MSPPALLFRQSPRCSFTIQTEKSVSKRTRNQIQLATIPLIPVPDAIAGSSAISGGLPLERERQRRGRLKQRRPKRRLRLLLLQRLFSTRALEAELLGQHEGLHLSLAKDAMAVVCLAR